MMREIWTKMLDDIEARIAFEDLWTFKAHFNRYWWSNKFDSINPIYGCVAENRCFGYSYFVQV
jgi:hypothetical protein